MPDFILSPDYTMYELMKEITHILFDLQRKINLLNLIQSQNLRTPIGLELQNFRISKDLTMIWLGHLRVREPEPEPDVTLVDMDREQLVLTLMTNIPCFSCRCPSALWIPDQLAHLEICEN